MTSNERGFSLIEIMIAIVILSVGVLGMVGTSALVSRMVGQGRRNTQASTVADQRMDLLRQTAMSTSPHCTALASGSATTGIVSETWTVTGAGRSRHVQIVFRYRGNRSTLADTVNTVIFC